MTQTAKVYCSCCAKQAVSYPVYPNDKYCTVREGGVASGTPGEIICRYCAVDIDENGLFPEERMLVA